MRSISGPGQAAVQAGSTPIVLFVEMQLAAPLYLNISSWDIEWAGQTWLGTKNFGAIEPITQTTTDTQGLRFQLSGVPSDLIAIALAEPPVQGKACNIYVGIMDPDSYALMDITLEWAGRLDTMTVREDSGGAVIQVTAEHVGIDLLRAAPTRYTDADQQRLHPGDKGLEFVNDSAAQEIVWPAASFFRQ